MWVKARPQPFFGIRESREVAPLRTHAISRLYRFIFYVSPSTFDSFVHLTGGENREEHKMHLPKLCFVIVVIPRFGQACQQHQQQLQWSKQPNGKTSWCVCLSMREIEANCDLCWRSNFNCQRRNGTELPHRIPLSVGIQCSSSCASHKFNARHLGLGIFVLFSLVFVFFFCLVGHRTRSHSHIQYNFLRQSTILVLFWMQTIANDRRSPTCSHALKKMIPVIFSYFSMQYHMTSIWCVCVCAEISSTQFAMLLECIKTENPIFLHFATENRTTNSKQSQSN